MTKLSAAANPTQANQNTMIQRLDASAAMLRQLLGRATVPETLVVLGSGFKGFETRLGAATSVNLSQVPFFPVPRVEGHGSQLVIGTAGTQEIAVLTGRVHLYEGHTPADVVYPLRTLARLGVKRLLLSNAAGSVDTKIQPGQIVALRDQINLTGHSSLIGADAAALGQLFIDMGAAFDAPWRSAILKAARTVKEGVYAGVLGPSYETPAEARMLGLLGAHVVGMSTVQEVLAARQLGIKVAGLSFVTNMAGGLGEALSHADVLKLVDQHKDKLHDVLLAAVGGGK